MLAEDVADISLCQRVAQMCPRREADAREYRQRRQQAGNRDAGPSP